MKLIPAFLLGMNILGFVLMFSDKQRAARGRRRIRERTLFLVAALGGSLGSILGMNLFRHKTKHRYFTLGMPLILFIQLAAGLILYLRWRPF